MKDHCEEFVMVVPDRDAWGFLLEHFAVWGIFFYFFENFI